MKVIIIIFFITIIASIMIFIGYHNIEAQRDRVIVSGKEKGYTLNFVDKKTFFIEEKSVKYYFDLVHSKVSFNRCEIIVEEPGVEVKEGNEIIIIERYEKDDNMVRVGIDDSRIIINDYGKEQSLNSYTFFISNTEFDESSLVVGKGIDARQKSIEVYDKAVRCISADKLKKYYNQALVICNELND